MDSRSFFFPSSMNMPARDVRAELLDRASAWLGGDEKLQGFLGVSPVMLRIWRAGGARVPDRLILRVIDLLDRPVACPEFEDVQGLGGSRFWRADLLAGADARTVLDSALSAVVAITRSPMGNIQLNRSGRLMIEAHRGFSRDFLDFFAVVEAGEGSCCAAAGARRARVVVTDVRRSPIFAGTESEAAMVKARAISCQSTPIVSQSGELLGVFSTHDESPGDHSAGCEEALDLAARRLAAWLAWRSSPAPDWHAAAGL